MLTFEVTEQDAIRDRGLMASTFIAQPFWIELQRGMYEAVQECMKAMRGAEHASQEIKANLFDRWLLTEKLVARIERIPQAAIEAARETGDNNG